MKTVKVIEGRRTKRTSWNRRERRELTANRRRTVWNVTREVNYITYESNMLFLTYYHTKHVLRKQKIKQKMEENKIQNDISENDSDDEDQEEVDVINSSD